LPRPQILTAIWQDLCLPRAQIITAVWQDLCLPQPQIITSVWPSCPILIGQFLLPIKRRKWRRTPSKRISFTTKELPQSCLSNVYPLTKPIPRAHGAQKTVALGGSNDCLLVADPTSEFDGLRTRGHPAPGLTSGWEYSHQGAPSARTHLRLGIFVNHRFSQAR